MSENNGLNMNNTDESKKTDEVKHPVEDNSKVPFDEAEAINAEPHSNPTERAVTTWRPEDAANFLAKAINESQKPLAKALARPSVPASVVWLIVVIFAVFIVGLLYQLNRMQEKNDKIAQNKITENVSKQDEANYRKVESVMSNLVKRLNSQKTDEAEKEILAEKVEGLTSALKNTEAQLEEKNNEIEKIKHSKQNIEEATDRISKLAIELEELKKENEKLELKKGRELKANKLLQNQIDAQSEAITALQKQLEAARKLISTLSGEETSAEEKPSEKKPEDQKQDNPDENINKNSGIQDEENNEENLEGMM